MNNKLKTILFAGVFVILIAFSILAYNVLKDNFETQNGLTVTDNKGAVSNTEKNKTKAPDFTVTDTDGKEVKLSDMLGRPIVLNFWASWCPPCKSEMPDFNNVYKGIGDDIIFMMVNMTDGRRETMEKGAQYIAGQGFSFPIYFDIKQEGAYNYGIRSIPTTVLIDKDGNIITITQGAIDEKTLRQGIELIK